MLLAENKNRISQFEISTSKMEKPKETQKDKKTIISKILILLTSLTLCYLVYQILQVSSINQDKILLEKENIKLLKYINTQPNNQIFSPSEQSKDKEILDHIFYPYSSNIITQIDDINFLRDILGPVRIRLEFQSSIHGDRLDVFKERSKKHNHQLVIIKTKNGNRFGGYTSENFEPIKLAEASIEIDKKDKTAFLFNLDSKKVYNLKKNTNVALFCDDHFFFNFGEGDLVIYDKFLSQTSFTSFPNNFGENAGKAELTNGEKEFKIEEMETFHVHFFINDFEDDYNKKGRYGKRSRHDF